MLNHKITIEKFVLAAKKLHDRIILLRGDGCAHKTNLTRHFLLCLCQAWKVNGHVNERDFDIISCCEF
jgi:tRNA A37 threonylcarbamoyladenosine biosynthesis protein TsaE